MEQNIFERAAAHHGHLNDLINDMNIYYQQKLWYQLSECIMKFTNDEKVQQGGFLIDFHENFVKEFDIKMESTKLVIYLTRVANQIPDVHKRIEFLHKYLELLKDDDAVKLITLQKGIYQLQLGEILQVKQIILDMQKRLSQMHQVENVVYSVFYQLCYKFHQLRKNNEEFYKSGLQYLAYTSEQDMIRSERENLCFQMAMAILTSQKIFNYSELLEIQVIKNLQNGQHGWIYNLLVTFSEGNVQKYYEQISQYQSFIQQTPLSQQRNVDILNDKIRIMAFLQLIFTLPKNSRQLNFSDINHACQVDLDKIEWMVMKSMSLGLIKGEIDEINKVVRITWVMPQVLDLERVQVMHGKFNQWHKTLNQFISTIESYRNQEL